MPINLLLINFFFINFYLSFHIPPYNNKIFYKKVIYNKDKNSYAIFEVSYLTKDKKIMDSIVTEMVKSFKIIK